MSEYFIGVISAVFILSFISYLSYSSGNGRGEKFASGLLLAYAILMPVSVFVSEGGFDFNLPELGDTAEEPSYEYAETAKAAFEEGIERLIADKFGARRDETDVIVRGFDLGSMSCEHISVYLSGLSALRDKRGIEQYITESGLGECEVFLSFG